MPERPAAVTDDRLARLRVLRLSSWPVGGAVAVLLLLPLAVYLPLLLPGRAPTDFDAIAYLYPYRHALAEAWSQGRWFPLWNPGIFLGVPFLANIQAAALYPPSLLFLLIQGPAAMGWSMVLALAVAGTGMFAYAWKTGLRLWGSLATAIAFVLSSHLTVHLAQLNQSGTFGWTPWLMLAFDRAAVRPRRRMIPAIAALVALTILAGHTQQAYLTFVLAGLAGLLGLRRSLRGRQWARAGLAALSWGAGLALGLALAAAQLLPTAELQRYSYRQGGLTLAEASVGALPIRGILGSLLPHYSAPLAPEYTGICTAAVVLALSALAVLARWRSAPVALWALASLLAIWAATGSSGKLFTILFHVVPGLDLFRVPSRLLLISTVGLALLAGHGVRTAQQLSVAVRHPGWARRGWRLIAGVATLMAVLLLLALLGTRYTAPAKPLRWLPEQVPQADLTLTLLFTAATILALCASLWRVPRATALAGLALVSLVSADSWLATQGYHTRHTVSASLYTATGPIASLVPASPDARYLSLVTVTDLGNVPLLVEARRPDLGMGDGRLSADGYDGGLLPLAAYVRFREAVLPPASANPPDLPLIHLTQRAWDPSWLRKAGVDAIVTSAGSDPNPAGCRCLTAVASSGGVTLWRPAGEPPTRAWVESPEGRRPARVAADTGEQVVVDLPGGPGRLVLADTFYPGWSATADGRPVPITRADGMLRAVAVPAGAHQVVFTYRPLSFQAGLAISLLALLATFALWLLPGSRGVRSGTPDRTPTSWLRSTTRRRAAHPPRARP